MLCIATVFLVGCSSAEWDHAAAMNEWESGNLPAAIEQLKSAIAKTSDNGQMKLTLARMYAENEQPDLGVALCDEHLETNPGAERAYRIRAVCQQYLGNFEESLDDYQNGVASNVEKSSGELNNLAYFRALAKQELPKAARQIDEAINMRKQEPWGSKYLASMPIQSSIAIGLISRHVDEQDMAIELLDARIEKYEDLWNRKSGLVNQLVAEMVAIDFPLTKETENQIDIARRDLEVTRNGLGLMLITRCLVNEDLGRHYEVDRDRHLIQDIGFEFEELLAALPDDLSCLEVLSDAWLYLDTRGFVLARLSWQSEDVQRWASKLKMNRVGLTSSYELALADLDLAVAAAELSYLASNSPLCNRYDIPGERVEALRRNGVRTIAVLRYHRMEAHLKAGNKAMAAKDESRIKTLGFEPDGRLF